jgi:histidinol phosphatase-like PHP family hydrolase
LHFKGLDEEICDLSKQDHTDSHTEKQRKEEKKILLRPYYIAKDCGCKFYLGSDSHEVSHLVRAKEIFERAIDILKLTENDKFHIIKP